MKPVGQLITPSFLVDLDKLEYNIKDMADLCKKHGKHLCPMVKTHKSADIAALQARYGVESFLTGTLDEAEMLISQGYKKITFPYPVAGAENIARVVALAKEAHITLSFDGVEAAAQFEAALAQAELALEYLIIIDSGLHRFGVQTGKVLELAQQLRAFSHLRMRGIATHPGHVYGKSCKEEVEAVAAEEIRSLEIAAHLLKIAGFTVDVVATGSTPTAGFAARSKVITTLRPGNYVFYDAIQTALGVVPFERCSLTVLATVIANPASNFFIMDAGSKCLGLDKGAHGVSLVNGYGVVKNHPELVVEGLSEEVGKLRVIGNTNLKVGDKIEIIPNHACAAANMTNFLIGCRQGLAETVFSVQARGGAKKPTI